MYHPTTRVLTVLELLQTYPLLSATDIAMRLEIETRTVRRYIMMLRDMGIPVDAERGREGGYYLRPGFKLPPLMLTNDEAFTLMLSLQITRQALLNGSPTVYEGLNAKLNRVMPELVQSQIEAIQNTLSIELDLPHGTLISTTMLTTLAEATQQHRQVAIHHIGFSGERTLRTIDPYGIAYRVGRWYVVGWCHLRAAIRTFRIDRVHKADSLPTIFEPQHDIDVLGHVEQSLAATPGIYRVEITFTAPLVEVNAQIPPTIGQFTQLDDTTHLVCFVQRLDWFAGFLSGLDLPLHINHPPELIDALMRLHKRVAAILS